MARIARVAVEKTGLSADKAYSYRVPPQMTETLRPGCRVLVPFGRSARRQGLVLRLEEAQELPPGCKDILEQVDASPLLGKELLWLLEQLRQSTFCTYHEALRGLVPSGIGLQKRVRCRLAPGTDLDAPGWSEEERAVLRGLSARPTQLETLCKKLGLAKDAPVWESLRQKGGLVWEEEVSSRTQDSRQTMVRLLPGWEQQKLTPKQQVVAAYLQENGDCPVKELCYYTGAGETVVKGLEKRGAAQCYAQQVYRDPYAGRDFGPPPEPVELTPAQQAALESLWELAQSGQSQGALLYGVTGSGKTQVYLRLVERMQSQGRGAMVLVPEISLTPQTVELFRRRFGRKVAVLHSGLSDGQRADEYRRIQNGEATLVVGTRSAVFAPLDNIGLIVLDEEQEASYRSEQAPRYDARQMARLRCRWHKALLLLASATPSMESYYAAQKGRLHLVRLGQRFTGRQLPQVTVADLSESYDSELSPQLRRELEENLKNGQQSILLLNRRGYHTIAKCRDCGQAVTCPHCSVALTYHSANGRMMCHYCGYSQPLPQSCPSCGSALLRYGGSGTQKLEELLGRLYPQARVLRMDLDSTLGRFAHEEGFARFAAGEYDIMVGTQMVAKGLNFPNVTLVGVLNADQALYAQDYRGCERAFSLITQVVGRCGRGELPGRAVIQTTSPDHPVIQQAARQDYEAFARDELRARRLGLYPPFCRMVTLLFSGERHEKVREAATMTAVRLREQAQENYLQLPLRMLEPCEPLVEKVAGRHRMRLLIKCRASRELHQLLWDLLCWYDRQSVSRYVHLSADPNGADQ